MKAKFNYNGEDSAVYNNPLKPSRKYCHLFTMNALYVHIWSIITRCNKEREIALVLIKEIDNVQDTVFSCILVVASKSLSSTRWTYNRTSKIYFNSISSVQFNHTMVWVITSDRLDQSELSIHEPSIDPSKLSKLNKESV